MSDSSVDPHLVLRETYHASFRKALELIIDMSSNLEDSKENLLCEKSFLDFGAGRHKKHFPQ
jgi:hypothetical protein